MSDKRVVIIGGNAAGMSAAASLRRLNDSVEIAVFEKGSRTSYSSCGIPYFVGGIIEDEERLIARTPEEFREKRIDVSTLHEVTSINVDERSLEVHDLLSGRSFTTHWDKLLIATGASPLRPSLPGVTAEGIFGVASLDSAILLRRWIEENRPKKAAVIGGGYIGLEMAEAMYCLLGLDTTVVERAPQLLATFDEDMARHVSQDMYERGIGVLLGETVQEFVTEKGRLVAVRTDKRTIEADVAVLGMGVLPNTALAQKAGLALGEKGSIAVDSSMRSSVPGIWAAGDCVQSHDLITGRPIYVALGTVANRQGRVAGFSLAGQKAEFPGILGTAVCQICSYEIGRTGRLERELLHDKTPHICGIIESPTRAAYMKDAGSMYVKLVAELPSGRILGGQIVGTNGAAKRVDVIAASITAGFTVDDLVDMDLSYAPPFSTVWDPVQQAARYIQGKIRRANS